MAWTKYKEIKYALGGIPTANLTDFPKLVSIVADTDIASELSGGGGVKFTSADGSSDLAFGLYPSSALASGTVLARVKIGSLLTAASVGDVIARLYYSSSESTSQNRAATVSNGYKLFAPLGEDPSGSAPQMRDWVTDSLLGTSAGTMTGGDLAAAVVGNGLDFDGSDDAINFGNGSGQFANLGAQTIRFHAYVRTSTANDTFLSKGSATDGGWIISITSGSNRTLRFLRDENTTDMTASYVGAVVLNQWRDYAFTIPAGLIGSDIKLYLDGAFQAASGSSSGGSDKTESTSNLVVGNTSGSVAPDAIIGQVEIANTERSTNWLAYAYADDFTNSGTFTLSAEQGGGGPTIRPSAIYYRSYLQGAAA
jgi:hypothetical protein